MTLSKQKIESLIQLISATRDEELTCDDCLSEMAQFAEEKLAGKSVQQSQQAVIHHLENCDECREEFEALLRSLAPSDRESTR